MSESFELLSPPPLPPFAAVDLAAAGYLARYSGRTRDAYTLDLKTFFAWCAERNTEVFAMTRPHLEIYVRWMEEQRGYPLCQRKIGQYVLSTRLLVGFMPGW